MVQTKTIEVNLIEEESMAKIKEEDSKIRDLKFQLLQKELKHRCCLIISSLKRTHYKEIFSYTRLNMVTSTIESGGLRLLEVFKDN